MGRRLPMPVKPRCQAVENKRLGREAGFMSRQPTGANGRGGAEFAPVTIAMTRALKGVFLRARF